MNDKELLFSVTADDCDWQYFCAGGKGGQYQNKTASACRCRHRASGAEGISRDHREQRRNRVEAFKRMSQTNVFQNWLKLESSRKIVSQEEKRLQEVRMEIAVDNMMHPSNIKIEALDKNGKWVEYREENYEQNG